MLYLKQNNIYNHPEFYGFLAMSILAVVYKKRYLAIILFIIIIFLMFFHRNPALSLKEPDENILYSPASGKIIDISPKGDNLLKISIFLSISDNHTQYIPMRCKKIGELFKYGYFYFAQKMEGSDYNQSLSHLLETKYGNITIIQYTGFFTRRIYSLTKNDRLYNVGDRLGYIRFGSRVDIILPLDKFDSVFVKKGQHIKALEPLAMFK